MFTLDRTTIQCLPGKIAVLVDEKDQYEGEVKVPDWMREKIDRLHPRGKRLLKGTVVAVGKHRGRVKSPPIGSKVYVMPFSGLTISHNDPDVSFGSEIPEGHTLRLFGMGGAWHDNVLVVSE